MRVTPAQMVASGQAFLRPFKSGRGFVCRTRLVAGGVTEVGTANRKGREAWARGLPEQGMVLMFLLLPQCRGARAATRMMTAVLRNQQAGTEYA